VLLFCAKMSPEAATPKIVNTAKIMTTKRIDYSNLQSAQVAPRVELVHTEVLTDLTIDTVPILTGWLNRGQTRNAFARVPNVEPENSHGFCCAKLPDAGGSSSILVLHLDPSRSLTGLRSSCCGSPRHGWR
jgi:hypothetical protein